MDISVIVKKSSPKNLAADCWPTVGHLSADRRPTGFPQNIDYQSADSRPTNDRQSADSWWCVGKMSVTCR